MLTTTKKTHTQTQIHTRTQLAMAIEESAIQHKAYFIASLTPLFDNDKPIDKEGVTEFYPMFKIRTLHISTIVRCWFGPATPINPF
jgi:hypothetical protein